MTDAPVPGLTEAPIQRMARSVLRVRSPAFRWGFALLAVMAALGTRVALDPYLPRQFPYPTFFPAVLITAALAGTAPAVGVALVSTLSAWYLFVPPLHSFELRAPEAMALLLFAVVSATEILLVHLMRHNFWLLAHAEARAKKEAEQRGLMFAELQHRVSNNLAVVGSLLSMQRREIPDPAAQRALDQAAARIDVVARLCRRLHDPDAQEIEFGQFLVSMVSDVLTVNGAEGRVSLHVKAEEVFLPASQAVVLGLVAMELMSNAVEHGFPERAGGRVEVSLEHVGSAGGRLIVRHDGLGLPPGFKLSQARSLGLIVAKQLAKQIGADLMLVQDRGVVSCLSFPVAERRSAPAETTAVPVQPASAVAGAAPAWTPRLAG